MTRQHAAPIHLPPGGAQAVRLAPLTLGAGAGQVSEAEIQALVQAHPQSLPIAEIDPLFRDPVPICTELNTPAGPIDNFLLTASGLPVIVECKLWRNPEGRREVIGQILDYAKELSRWSVADLQREVRRRLGMDGDPLLDRLQAAGHAVDPIDFADAVSANLRRGRFLLLIVGDGIREGVEAIVDYIQAHAGLHFTLGLVEMPIYEMADGSRLVVPRVLARTQVLTRTVVAVPDGMAVAETAADEAGRGPDPETVAAGDERQLFWREFLSGLVLDDPEQAIGKPPRMGYIGLTMPVPGGVSWLTVWRNQARGEVGVFLSYNHGSLGERIARALAGEADTVLGDLGGTARLADDKGRPYFGDKLQAGRLDEPDTRAAAFAWLRARTNDFVNVLRPRIRALAADLAE